VGGPGVKVLATAEAERTVPGKIKIVRGFQESVTAPEEEHVDARYFRDSLLALEHKPGGNNNKLSKIVR
jgi:hypothetical protein